DRKMLPSLAQVADQSWSYNIKSETTPFLTAFPQPRHSFLFKKVVVNLRKRVSSLSEAMGAFEFFVEVYSKDAARELKGREVQLRDLIQRTAEQFTYESLQSEKGKERLKERIRSELNKELAQGWVKAVFIKFMVTKP
ncbi:MAG: flagellar basal body-associated FliL family protein, partial [Pseudomonadota bacterium]